MKLFALGLAASAAFLTGSTQAAVITNTFDLGPFGTPTTFGGDPALPGYFTPWSLGSPPSGSILRSVSIDATIEETDQNNWISELMVLVEPSSGIPGSKDGILEIGPDWDPNFGSASKSFWSATGNVGPVAGFTDTKTAGADFPTTIDLNAAKLFLMNAYGNGFGKWSGTVSVTYDVPGTVASIDTFGLPGKPAVISGTDIAWGVPPGTDVTKLAPTYTTSFGAMCDKASGSTHDFTSPVTYTVTSGDHSTTTVYTVRVEVLPFFISTTALNVTATATGAEILNDAVLVEANHFYRYVVAPVTLLNGLTFGTDWSHTTPTGLSDSHQRTDSDAHGHVPLLTDSTAYGKLMRSYSWSSYSAHYLNIPDLTPGHTYRLQLISGHNTLALVSVEGNADVTWTGGNTVLTAIWTQGPGDTEANVVLTRNGPELETTAYALHDMSLLPPTPTGLTPTPLVGEIRLDWAQAPGAAYYNVKRSTTSGSGYVTIATPAYTTTIYHDTAVVNGTTYYYVLSSANSAGESANSGEVSATPSVVKVDQTITFDLGLTVTKTTTNAPFSDLASATSLLPVTYSCTNTDVASVDPITGLVTLHRVPGTAYIRANQAGNTAYNPAPEVVQELTVTQVMPVISWITPRAIAVGTPLSSAQLNATCTAPGTFTYTPTNDAVLPLGVHTLSVHFTPDEPAAYSTPEDKTVTITVGSAEGPTVINVNYGLQANSAMNGYYSFDPTACGTATQPAPAPYGGDVWNDFGGNSGSVDLLDSKGASTGVGFSWGTGATASPYNDWNGLGFNRLLISGRFLNTTTYDAVFTLTGLNAAHKYDLYIASLHNTEQTSVDFQAVGAGSAELHCQYVNATDWVAGEDYVHFTDVVPAADGTLVVNAQKLTGGGYLNGFQLQDMGAAGGPTTTLIITPPDGSGNFTVSGTTSPGLTVHLWKSLDLSLGAAGWTDAGTTNADGTTGAFSFPLTIGDPKAFYQVKP